MVKIREDELIDVFLNGKEGLKIINTPWEILYKNLFAIIYTKILWKC